MRFSKQPREIYHSVMFALNDNLIAHFSKADLTVDEILLRILYDYDNDDVTVSSHPPPTIGFSSHPVRSAHQCRLRSVFILFQLEKTIFFSRAT